jgi:hypothetical protein
MMQRRYFGLQLFFGVVLTVFMASAPVMAAPAQGSTQTVQTLETTLFAVQYDQDPLETRVGRLEETVFGQRQSGTLDGRIEKLKIALSPSTLGPLSAQPKNPVTTPKAKDSQLTVAPTKATAGNTGKKTPLNRTPASNTVTRTTSPAPAAGESDYPTISQMELKLFGKSYLQEDITVRLARLEKEVFKVPQTGALSDRMDNLQLVVLGDTGVAPPPSTVIPYIAGSNNVGAPTGPYSTYTPPPYGQMGNGYPPPPAYGAPSQPGYYPGSQVATGNGSVYGNPPFPGQPVPGNYQPQTYGMSTGEQQTSYQPVMAAPGMGGSGQVSPDLLAAMDEVEKQVLGHTYPSEPVNNRLDRLEARVFHTTSPEMEPNERVQRVIAVASAGGAPSSPKAKAKSTFQNLLPIILTILPLILL